MDLKRAETVTETFLRSIFKKYGDVVDVTINKFNKEPNVRL
jgi:hypothetical protein